MRYIEALTELEKLTLEEASKNSSKFHFRRRCDAILLSYRGKSVPYISDYFGIPNKTVYRWFTRWHLNGISGLILQKGRGLKAILDSIIDESLEQELRSSIALNPQKLAEVAADLSEKTATIITYSMLKRFIKRCFNYTWKRLKKWLKPKQDPKEYERLYEQLQVLKQLESDGFLKIYYGDQSSFSLNPNVPYGWQPKEYTKIVPQKGTVSNIFGLLSKDNELQAYSCKTTMTSALMIALIEDFINNKDKPQKITIVLDNAPIHKSEEFIAAVKEWQEKHDLFVFFLPTYSPHLNLIETLWRKMKGEWLKPQDYKDPTTLQNAVEHILKNIGGDFVIKFAS